MRPATAVKAPLTSRTTAAVSADVANALAISVRRATGTARIESRCPRSSAPAIAVATQRSAMYASANGSTMPNISACR